MTTALQTRPAPSLEANVRPMHVPAPTRSAFAHGRDTACGPFSLTEDGPIAIDAEPGLVIRVHQGCLWVPCAAEQCSIGVGAGESVEPRNAGRLYPMGRRGTQVELVWPTGSSSAAATSSPGFRATAAPLLA